VPGAAGAVKGKLAHSAPAAPLDGPCRSGREGTCGQEGTSWPCDQDRLSKIRDGIPQIPSLSLIAGTAIPMDLRAPAQGWPRKIDRQAIDDHFGLGFIAEGINVILVGPNKE
jgi:hypothetical protein